MNKMIDWIMKLFSICEHKWDIHDEVRVFANDSDKIAIGSKFILRCAKCGGMKMFKTYT